MKLSGKKILLGVSGSIAAYKSADLIRLLVKQGADVQVIMTQSATEFITPLTLSTLSKKPVLSRFSDPVSGSWNNHVELGLWADLLLIAPASAHTLAKLVHGYCDDLLSAVYLSARCPVMIAPAMDLDMFAHPATQDNIRQLSSLGVIVIGPESGELASGLTGKGRMTEPVGVVDYVMGFLSPHPKLKDKKVLITAGGTRESIDPVRYISNRSTGKMGVALASEFARKGSDTILIHGPGVEVPAHRNIQTIAVESASEMFTACMNHYPECDITIMAAAVADYTPATTATQKIKKTAGPINLEMIRTTDILAEMGRLKSKHQLLIGFALETENEVENATRKLREKNLDLIILNSLNDAGAGFQTDTNKITIIGKNSQTKQFPLKSKKEVAADITDTVITLLSQ
jgi:phosphopantothenoylcysteine decarboxylase / phosphopantothenate---cysteine ligase